jgi:hypothetical protein
MGPRVEDAATLPTTYAQAFDETGLPNACRNTGR